MLPSERATEIVRDRQSTYGHPYRVYNRAAGAATALLHVSLDARSIAIILLCVKLAREIEANYPVDYSDNLDDVAGYANVLAMVKEAMHGLGNPPTGARGVGEEKLSGGDNPPGSPRRDGGGG